MQKADLHIHTRASDGLLTPEEVVNWAKIKGISAISITDHDTIDGVREALVINTPDLKIVPGIELSCNYDNEEIHILGYYIDYDSPHLLNILSKLKESRLNRSTIIIEKLNSIGLNISIEDFDKISSNNSIGRPHIGRILISKGYVSNMKEAFDRFLGIDKPGYVERYKLDLSDSINLIHSTGGVAVIAHPGLISNKEAIFKAVAFGADGIEVVHSKHSIEMIDEYKKLADTYNLIKTGGSDCHGNMINGKPILGDFFIDYDSVTSLYNKAIFYRSKEDKYERC